MLRGPENVVAFAVLEADIVDARRVHNNKVCLYSAWCWTSAPVVTELNDETKVFEQDFGVELSSPLLRFSSSE
jgi:hypothetical protein